jgi:flagellar basal body-associated protein FliL
MKKSKSTIKLYIILSIVIIFLVGAFISTPLYNDYEKVANVTDDGNVYETFNLKSSNIKNLNYSSIFQNVTSLNRLFESIYFSVNVSGFNNANYTIMQISYPNQSFKNFSMGRLNEDQFEYIYTPNYDSNLGFHRVNFYIFNQTDFLLNTHTTYINFTVTSNYMGKISSPEFNRGDFAEGEFEITDYGLHAFTWELTVVDNLNESLENNLFDLGTDQEAFYFHLNDSFSISNHMYYVKIKVTDTFYSEIDRIYVPFMLLNSLPYVVPGSVDFSASTIKRDEECTVSLNVTDGDRGIDTFANNMTVLITIQDSRGVESTPTPITNNGDWTFEYTFSIAITKPIGRYQIIFKVFDQFISSSESSYIEPLIVENNLPEIHGFTINGISVANSISINYGENIRFKFNVSDVENTISFISIHLLNENNEWYNISSVYNDNMELIVRTVDLVSGSWYVYITVYDKDGGITSLTSDYGFAPKEIRIIPDILQPILPWIALIVGIIFGFLVGIAFVYRYFKSKYSLAQEGLSEKKKAKKKKFRAKKIQEQPEKEEIKPEKLEEDTEKEPSEQKPLQRKIKRRLK